MMNSFSVNFGQFSTWVLSFPYQVSWILSRKSDGWCLALTGCPASRRLFNKVEAWWGRDFNLCGEGDCFCLGERGYTALLCGELLAAEVAYRMGEWLVFWVVVSIAVFALFSSCLVFVLESPFLQGGGRWQLMAAKEILWPSTRAEGECKLAASPGSRRPGEQHGVWDSQRSLYTPIKYLDCLPNNFFKLIQIKRVAKVIVTTYTIDAGIIKKDDFETIV